MEKTFTAPDKLEVQNNQYRIERLVKDVVHSQGHTTTGWNPINTPSQSSSPFTPRVSTLMGIPDRSTGGDMIKFQVLTGLELSRQAQIIANEACLKHISQGKQEDLHGLQKAMKVCDCSSCSI